jgi:fatty acid desaturase
MTPVDTRIRPTPELRELSRLRSTLWLRDLALDWSIIVATIAAYGALDSPWALPPATLVIGARQHALGLLGHEAAHGSAFTNRRVNDLFGELFAAWPLFVTLAHGYRPWHFQHHRNLGTESDPELAYRTLPPYTLPITRSRIVLWFLLDMGGAGIPDLFRFLGETLPDRRWRLWGPFTLYALCFAVSWWFDFLWVLALWLGSLLTGFWAVFRVRTWYEHVGLERAGREGTHRFRANPLVRFLFFPHNTQCHYEHHRWPGIPYYNLPKLRSAVAGRPILTAWQVLVRFPQCDGHVGVAQASATRDDALREATTGDT